MLYLFVLSINTELKIKMEQYEKKKVHFFFFLWSDSQIDS